MKSTFLKLFSLLLVSSFVLTSCGDDDPDPITGTAPTITLTDGEGNVGSTFSPNEEISFTFDVERGSSDMNSLEVKENGNTIAENSGRIKFNDTIPSANPTLLFAGQEDDFSVKVTILTNTTPGTYDIDVIVTDSNSPNPRSTTYTVEYSVAEPNLEEIEGVLFNAAGPQNTGGLNLNTGESTNSTEVPDSHIKDLGITSGPVDTNWRQKIAPISENGVSLRILSSEVDYNNVQYANQLEDLYNGGTEVGSEGTANKNVVGDTFVAKKGDDYWIFVIRNVTITPGMDNSDNYELDIKKQ